MRFSEPRMFLRFCGLDAPQHPSSLRKVPLADPLIFDWPMHLSRTRQWAGLGSFSREDGIASEPVPPPEYHALEKSCVVSGVARRKAKLATIYMLASGNMSCVDVMYQPYASYFPYQRPSATSPVDPFKKFSSMKSDPLDTSGSLYSASSTIPSMAAALSSSQHISSSSSTAGHSLHAPSSSPVATATSVVTKLEDPTSPHPQHQDGRHRHSAGSSSAVAAGGGSGPGEKEVGVDGPTGPTNAQYLSTNCVLFTYYAGDVAANVDEHFTRALSQGSNNSGSSPYHTDGSSPVHDGKNHAWKATSPMAQRNFPASFWNSSYQPSSSLGHDPLGSLHSASSDAYMTSQLHSMSSLGSDPWRYSLTSQSHTVPYSHNPHNVHDMAYATMAGTSRFQPHYSSLLGPAGRLGSVSGQCDLGKHAVDGWSSRYHPENLSSSLPSHHDTTHHLHSAITAGGIEPAVQEPSKDLYWF